MVTSIKGNATSTFGGNVDVTGNVITDAPAFRAYRNSNQSVSSSTWTKVQVNAENFDTNNNYDHTTNYRFTPTVAGYYQVNYRVRLDGVSMTSQFGAIYKNGSIVSYANTGRFSTSNDIGVNGADIIYMNGTTDYLELYTFTAASSGNVVEGDANVGFMTFMSAHLVRGI